LNDFYTVNFHCLITMTYLLTSDIDPFFSNTEYLFVESFESDTGEKCHLYKKLYDCKIFSLTMYGQKCLMQRSTKTMN